MLYKQTTMHSLFKIVEPNHSHYQLSEPLRLVKSHLNQMCNKLAHTPVYTYIGDTAKPGLWTGLWTGLVATITSYAATSSNSPVTT